MVRSVRPIDDRALRLGVSSCLAGLAVRYDGAEKQSGALSALAAAGVELVTVCPEVELGMGVPRPPIRITAGGAIDEEALHRLEEVESGRVHTKAMLAFSADRVRALESEDLAGFVLKSASPSCGLSGVKVWREGGSAFERRGRGFFARTLKSRLPNLPLAEEQDLENPATRQPFIEAICGHRRVRALFEKGWTAGDVVAFHTDHKMQLLAHSEPIYRELGRFVAAVRTLDRSEFEVTYQRGFMRALGMTATVERQRNVLQHMVGHLRDRVPNPDRRAIAAKIQSAGSPEDLDAGRRALLDQADHYEITYLARQTYLNPEPLEQKLRSMA